MGQTYQLVVCGDIKAALKLVIILNSYETVYL